MITENLKEMIQPLDTGRWTRLLTTKYKGKTLPQVIFHDPDYFFWGYEHEVFTGVLKGEAEDIYYKARHIKVPQRKNERLVVKYYIHRPTRKFETIELIPASSVVCHGQDFTMDVIDLSVPRQISTYDKCGSKNMILKTKAIVFKNPGYKMTKKRCEDFFDDVSHFVM